MQLRRSCTGSCLLLLCCAVLAGPTPALASHSRVSSVTGVALRAGDAPAGFSHSGKKVYPTWVPKMVIKLATGSHGSNSSSCTTSKALSRGAWKQGLIDYVGKDTFNFVQECAYLVTSDAGAKAVYAAMSKNLNTKVKGTTTTIFTTSIGDQSKGVELKGSGVIADAILWRHGNALVGVADFFYGKPAISRSQFIALCSNIDGRF